MKKFLKSLFSDDNKINEKSFIGFLAFLMMIGFALADIITGALGKELVVQDFIFNSFLWLTLGCFGIASVDKFINNKKDGSEEEAL
jgi:hypothetical protein